MKRIIPIVLTALLLTLALTLCVSAEESAPGEEAGAGEIILDFFRTYSAEIFSGMTLAASLLLAYLYKRGLLPVLVGGIDSIARTAREAEEKTDAVADALPPLLERLQLFCDRAGEMREEVETLGAQCDKMATERETVIGMMRGVADMLYGIFTSANLPDYAKEQIGQRYTAITALLGGTDHADAKESTPL